MFEWLFGNKTRMLEEETKKGFSAVKDDIDKIGKWIKHLDNGDEQLFEMVSLLKGELSTMKRDISELRELIEQGVEIKGHKQLFKKLPVVGKQVVVVGVQEGVQTAVQTGNFYGILRSLTSNERLIVFTLLNSENEMKLSYEDLALVLGKERATIRGQINAIKQKCEGLIEEITEKNGKKRVYIAKGVREKLLRYAKVRVRGSKKL